jgi:hypothetical protein
MLRTLRAPIYVPSPHVDPITTSQETLAVFSLAIKRPLHPELLAIMLDHQFRGIGLFSFDFVEPLGNAIDKVIGMCSATDAATMVILASVHPRPGVPSTDQQHWDIIRNACQRAGITALDWYVVSPGGIARPSRH